jgi:N-acetylglutamate synthase
MSSEAQEAHRALVSMSSRLYDAIEGARFEPQADLIVAVCPDLPIPQFNGAWVVEDSPAAVAALPGAIAEVEAAGAWPWVQTRSGQERTRAAAAELGFTHVERVPGMVVLPAELHEMDVEIEIRAVADAEIDEATAVLSLAFGAPKELFDALCAAVQRLPDATWYVGRVAGTIVSTAVGLTVDRATGIFNVATQPEQRRRGYGAALTSRAAFDGFESGAEFAFLQSSELGHGVYRRLGFRDVEEYVLLTRPPSGS